MNFSNNNNNNNNNSNNNGFYGSVNTTMPLQGHPDKIITSRFIMMISIAPLQGDYSGMLLSPARLKVSF